MSLSTWPAWEIETYPLLWNLTNTFGEWLGYWYDPWQFIFRSGYLTEVNWINDSKFSLTFINRLQTRFTIILCEITGELSSVCSKASGSLLLVLQNSSRIIYLISLYMQAVESSRWFGWESSEIPAQSVTVTLSCSQKQIPVYFCPARKKSNSDEEYQKPRRPQSPSDWAPLW